MRKVKNERSRGRELCEKMSLIVIERAFVQEKKERSLYRVGGNREVRRLNQLEPLVTWTFTDCRKKLFSTLFLKKYTNIIITRLLQRRRCVQIHKRWTPSKKNKAHYS